MSRAELLPNKCFLRQDRIMSPCTDSFRFRFAILSAVMLCVPAMLCIAATNVWAAEPAAPGDVGAKSTKPKIVLVGDSIRMGYAPFVIKALDGQATVVSSRQNGADTANVLRTLDTIVIAEQPDIVHINCGLHDLKFSKKTKTHQVPPEQYEKNLREIVGRIKKETKARLIFATTTPIVDSRHAARKADFDRTEADVVCYNDIARKVMQEMGVEINDLHKLVVDNDSEKMLGADGTHYSAAGSEKLAKQVVEHLLKPAAKAP